MFAFLQLTRVWHAVQPAVPAFFGWLSTRLPSLELVNVEVEDDGPGDPEEAPFKCRWCWPLAGRGPVSLPPPAPADGRAPLRAVRLVRLPSSKLTCELYADRWLAPLASYSRLAALYLANVAVTTLPVLPQLRALIFSYGTSDTYLVQQPLLDSIARQPVLKSVWLGFCWGSDSLGPAFLFQSLRHLRHLGLHIQWPGQVQDLQDWHVAVPDECAVALVDVCCAGCRPPDVPLVSQAAGNLSSLDIVNPDLNWRSWRLSRFGALTALRIFWSTWSAESHRMELSALLAALPSSVGSVCVEAPMGWEVVSPLILPPTLTALKLSTFGPVSGDQWLDIVLHSRVKCLRVFAELLSVSILGDIEAFQGLK